MRKLLHMSVNVAEKHLIVNQNRWVHRKKKRKTRNHFWALIVYFLVLCVCMR